MAGDLQANIVIRAIDRATSTLRRVTKNFETMRAAQKRADKSLRRAAELRQAAEGVRSFSRVVTKAVQGPIDSFEDFQAMMSSVRAVSAGITDKEFAALTARAEQLGAVTRWTATQAAEAMKYFSIAGFSAEKTLQAVPTTLDLATAAGTDLGRTADIVSDLMGSLGVSMRDLPNFANQVTRTFTGANVTLETLFESLTYAGPVARQMEIANKDLLAMTGLLGGVGIKGSTAGTALRSMIARLTAGRRRGQKTLEALNIEIADMDGNLRPLPDILTDILARTSKMGTVARGKAFKYIFGTDAMTAASSLATMGREEILSFADQVENGSKTVEDVARIMDENARGATIRLSSAMEGLSITLGKQLEPALTALKVTITSVVQGINGFAKRHPILAKAIMISAGALAVLTTGLAALIFTMSAAATATRVFALALGSQRTGAQLLGAALKPIGGTLRRAIPAIATWGASWWPAAAGVNATLWPILAIVAAIVATTAAVYFAIKYWDRLVEIWERFRLVSTKTKVVVLALLAPFQVLIAPITALIALVKIITADWEGLKTSMAAPFVFVIDQVKSLIEWLSKIELPAPLAAFGKFHEKIGAGIAGFFSEIGSEMKYIATGGPAEAGAVDYRTSEHMRRTNDVSVGGTVKIEVDAEGQARATTVDAFGVELDVGYGLPAAW